MKRIWKGPMTTVVFAALIASCPRVWAQTQPIGGVVVDESDNPVAGATVSVVTMTTFGVGDLEIAREAKTGDDGQFSLSIEEGKVKSPYSLYVAKHPDYGLAWTASTFAARRGEDPSDLRFVLPKRGSVQGKVVDPAGKPVEDALISAFIALPEGAADDEIRFLLPCEQVLKATSGADGAFLLDNLPASATVMLRVSHPDFAIGLAGVPEAMQRTPMGLIDVGATDVEVKLEPGAVIEGTITIEQTGEPAEGAVVQVSPPREDFATVLKAPKTTETDADGRYVLRGLAAGKYGVSVTHPDGTASPITVDVATGERLTAQDIVLGKGVLVSGKFVYAETGKPVPDGQVMAIRTDVTGPSRQTPVEVKADGTFSFREPPGEIRVYGFTIYGARVQRELTLVAGKDLTDVVLEIQPPLTFKGKVMGPDGKGIANARVFSKWRGLSQAPVTTAADGSFEAPLGGQRPGEYELLCLEARHPDVPGYRGLFMKPFESESDTEGVIELKRTATIRGHVVTEDDEPIPSAKVRTTVWSDTQGWLDVNATTDDSGRYEFTDILADTQYSVTANAERFGQVHSERFTLDEGETRQLTVLVLIVADQTIEGTVVDEDGKPVSGASVNARSRATGSRHTTTNEKGHFRLENLVDEEIQISVFHQRPDGYVQGSAQAMAGDTDIEIVLGEQQRPVSPEERQQHILVGKQAPELDVAEWIKGEPTTLESLRGKTIVLAFCDSADEASGDLVTLLNGLVTSHASSGVQVVCVYASGAQPEALKNFISDKSIKFPVALDKPAGNKSYRGATFETYQARRLPAIYIIDAEGKVKYQDLPLGAVEQAMKTVMSGE